MRIYKLTVPAQRIVQAIDSGDYKPTSTRQVLEAIRDGTIFKLLEDRADLMVPLSGMTPVDRLEVLMEWQDYDLTFTPNELGVEDNGLLLILYFMLEGIQRRLSRSSGFSGLTDESYGSA